MIQNGTIANLAKALVAAQADIKTIGKDATNPHYKNKYASLDAIIEAVRPVLAKHGLAVVQGATTPMRDEAGGLCGFTVETWLVHSSGESLTNEAFMPLTKVDAQGAGGAMTYGRRYGLSALLCLATDEDDDGNTASTPRPATNSAPRSNGGSLNGNDIAPADRPMPFGKTKGKKLSEHTTEQLQKTITWCQDTDAAKFKDLMGAIRSVLDARALGDSPDQRLQTVLHHGDDNDGLPF